MEVNWVSDKDKKTTTPKKFSKEIINQTKSVFEQIRRLDEKGNEFWSARDLAKAMEYSEYRHFQTVIEKAKEACRNSVQRSADHFEDILDMVQIRHGRAFRILPPFFRTFAA
jgi:hypothetical protein